ncbi:MAG: MBL fold metallo-hydrolase [Acidobacteriota bacterium]
MTTLQFLGAADCVTGSRFCLRHNGEEFLIDCGLFQGRKELRLRNWSSFPVQTGNIQHLVLTHAHLDHSGYLPKLVREGFRGNVYASPATVDLCGLLLPDSGHIQEDDARYANKKGFSKHKPALPLYTEQQAIESLSLLKAVPYGRSFDLSDEVSITLKPSGHILGASLVSMQLRQDSRPLQVLFSGDLGRFGQPITHDPAPVQAADYLLVESTYGDRLHEEGDSRQELAAVITKTAARGGMVLIPSFAVGRAQELMYILRELEDSGDIPKLPVYVDSPMAINATRLLMKYPEEHDLEMTAMESSGIDSLNCHEVHFVRSAEHSKELNEQRFPMIVIASSGMATGGRVLHHLIRRLPDSRNTILFVGYQAEGTRGRAMLDGAEQIKIHGRYVTVRAEVKSLGYFSAHADYSEMLRWLRNLRQAPRATFLVHGESAPREALARRIREELGWRVILPGHLEECTLT